jgi:hypothetical protein
MKRRDIHEVPRSLRYAILADFAMLETRPRREGHYDRFSRLPCRNSGIFSDIAGFLLLDFGHFE